MAGSQTNLKSQITEQVNEEAVSDSYYSILQLLQKISKKLNDDDAHELHERLKDFFNRII